MGYRAYGEPKYTKANPLAEFSGGFLMGFIGFPLSMGWVLPAWGIASWPAVWMIAAAAGVWIGCDLGLSAIKFNKACRSLQNNIIKIINSSKNDNSKENGGSKCLKHSN